MSIFADKFALVELTSDSFCYFDQGLLKFTPWPRPSGVTDDSKKAATLVKRAHESLDKQIAHLKDTLQQGENSATPLYFGCKEMHQVWLKEVKELLSERVKLREIATFDVVKISTTLHRSNYDVA